MGTRTSRMVLLLGFVLPACAQGSNSGGATFGGSFSGSSPDDDDDGSATGDDDGESTAGGSGGDGSGGGSTAGPADTTAGGSNEGTGESTGAPVTATGESTSDGGPGSSDGGGETSTSGPVSTTDDGGMDADVWDDCAAANCVAGSACINVTGLRDHSPYCAPECVVDADCPDPGGTAQILCILVEEGAVDPTHCAAICSIDNVVQGNCPAGMDCADVPGQMTQVSVCMWP